MTLARNFELEARALQGLDADGLRVYADWLQTQGDPRGELVSLELHRPNTFMSERRALRAEIAEREAPYRERFAAWAEDKGLRQTGARFRQGFLIELEAPLATAAPCFAELFAREPIQRLKLTEVRDAPLAALLRAHGPCFDRLRYLKLSGQVGMAATEALAQLPLARLEGLNLIATGLDPLSSAPLAQLRTTRLRALSLTSNELDDAALAALLLAPSRTQWRALYLAQNPLTSASIEALAQAEGLEQLEGLYLDRIEAKFTDYALLAASERLPALQTLELSSHGSWRERALIEQLQERFAKLKLR